ncbi:MAG: inorganic phosphate transporter [Chlamydiales bacterium]|nr:inorganic phosphate transporter [Chlamydiales bacterium]
MIGHEGFILVLALILGFYLAWNIGANDVANAMGTSVGSGALTLKRAIIIAALLEFCGAFFVGAHVTETIEKGLINTELFYQNPNVLLYGMLASLLATGVWLQIASYFGWPVSTTHCIIGSVVGFGLILGGVEAVEWTNLIIIGTSWVLSPLMGGILSFGIFTLLRRYIFYSKNPVRATKRIAPILVFGVFSILSLVVLFKGLTHLDIHLDFLEALGISVGMGIVTGLLTYILLRSLKDKEDADVSMDGTEYAVVEKIFIPLQIVSACCMAFAHGANDVANAIGPLASIVSILHTHQSIMSAEIPTWILALGGLGIVVGLATWGWRVIETIGKKLTELTPSRGFAAEFGAATTILLASKLGLPVSTTHTLVGSVLGVGLARGIGALNLGMIREIVLSWVVTIPVGALLSVLFYYCFAFFI